MSSLKMTMSASLPGAMEPLRASRPMKRSGDVFEIIAGSSETEMSLAVGSDLGKTDKNRLNNLGKADKKFYFCLGKTDLPC